LTWSSDRRPGDCKAAGTTIGSRRPKVSHPTDTRTGQHAGTRQPGLDQLIADLHAAGLVTVGRGRDGHATLTLTDEGARLADILDAWQEDSPTGRLGSVFDAFVREP
jgi:hypothetical protein